MCVVLCYNQKFSNVTKNKKKGCGVSKMAKTRVSLNNHVAKPSLNFSVAVPTPT